MKIPAQHLDANCGLSSFSLLWLSNQEFHSFWMRTQNVFSDLLYILLLILYNILLILALISNLHRWKNYWIRGVLSLAMISGFFLIIYMGPIALILVVSVFFGGFGCKKNRFMFCIIFVKTQNEAHSLNLLLVAELCSHVSIIWPRSCLSKSSVSKKLSPLATEFTIPMTCHGLGH